VRWSRHPGSGAQLGCMSRGGHQPRATEMTGCYGTTTRSGGALLILGAIVDRDARRDGPGAHVRPTSVTPEAPVELPVQRELGEFWEPKRVTDSLVQASRRGDQAGPGLRQLVDRSERSHRLGSVNKTSPPAWEATAPVP